MIFIGAENIISPLGFTANENFTAIVAGKSGLKPMPEKDGAVLSKMTAFDVVDDTVKSIQNSLSLINLETAKQGTISLVLSTTKGKIDALESGNTGAASLIRYKENIAAPFDYVHSVKLVSNACISGVLAIIVAFEEIRAGLSDTVIVSGSDMLSDFTLEGFKSFFALSDEKCQPFDKNRKGINLGEGAATVIVSNNPSIFNSTPIEILGGSTANDANHISGPSRDGEGLFRCVNKTLKSAEIQANQVDFISAHGTGTNYNDEMESIAFDRIGLNKTPLNSLKGFYGHTFGAAGLIESAICLQAMRNNIAPASHGFQENGTSKPIHVLKENLARELNIVLKTASGFGGCNASILMRKWA